MVDGLKANRVRLPASTTSDMTRQDVYTLIDGERAFQDKTWPAASLPPLSPTSTLRLIEVLKTRADSIWHRTQS